MIRILFCSVIVLHFICLTDALAISKTDMFSTINWVNVNLSESIEWGGSPAGFVCSSLNARQERPTTSCLPVSDLSNYECDPFGSDSCVLYFSKKDHNVFPKYVDMKFLSSCPQQGGAFYSSQEVISCMKKRYSRQELEKLYRDVIFPSVKSAVDAFGMSIDGNTCNLASAYTANAFKMLGVEGVAIKEGPQHVYLEIEDREGTNLVFDSTIAQFVRKGTESHARFMQEGFLGTPDELRKYITENITDYVGIAGAEIVVDERVLAAARGERIQDISKEEALIVLGPHVDHQMDTYFADTLTFDLKKSADRQVIFFENHDLSERFIRSGVTGVTDSTVNTRRGYRALLKSLQKHMSEFKITCSSDDE